MIRSFLGLFFSLNLSITFSQQMFYKVRAFGARPDGSEPPPALIAEYTIPLNK